MRADLHEPDVPREAMRLWRLGWPVSLGMFGMVSMGTTDTIVVGWLGEDALAGLAIGNIWAFSMMVFAFGALRALDPVVSQAFGEGDEPGIRRALAQGIALSLWLSVPLCGWYMVAASGLTLLGQPADVVPLAAQYVRALIPGIPLMLTFTALRAWLQGFEVMRPAAWAVLLGNLLNVPLDLVLVHGAGTWSGLGPTGAGIATSLCNLCLLLTLVWLVREPLRAHWTGFQGMLGWRAQIPMIRLGLPLGLQTGLEVWAFNLSGILMGWFGETALAAHAAALNLASLTFMFALGISQAGATRVGNLFGAGMPWHRAAMVAVAMGGLGMSASATLFLLFPSQLASVYSPDIPVRELAASLIPLAGAFQVFDGLQVTMFGVLRGAGDIQIPTLANVLGYWVIGLPVGAWLAFSGGWGPEGIWIGLVIGLAVVTLVLTARLAQVMARGGTRVSA